MTQVSGSRPNLERWLALLVRYWAFNMSLVHDRGVTWAGFRYNEEEKVQLKTIAGKVPSSEYYVWLALVVVMFIAILIVIVIAGMTCLIYAIGGAQNMSKTPAPLFFLQLALDLVTSLSVGFPAAMLASAALVGRWFRVADADLPDRATNAHYLHRLWFQITRVTLLGVLALIPIWIFVPGDSKFWVIAQIVLPLLSPAVAVLTSAYYFTARLRRGVPNT